METVRVKLLIAGGEDTIYLSRFNPELHAIIDTVQHVNPSPDVQVTVSEALPDPEPVQAPKKRGMPKGGWPKKSAPVLPESQESPAGDSSL